MKTIGRICWEEEKEDFGPIEKYYWRSIEEEVKNSGREMK